jgi:hypothetical protein
MMSSDEADRRRAYAELEKRGQKVPGKYFGPSTPKLRVKKTPEVKTIDMTKMKQLKLFKTGGNVDPLKGLAKMITNIEKGKTGIKTVDMQKRKDAALTKNLKKLAKRTKVRAKPQTLDITPKPGGAFSIQKETITMAKDGGLMEAIKKVKAKEMETGGEAVPKKFKGFSKLPEAVQEKMDPTLAKKFEDGGPVKMGSGGGVCRGMGIARAGGKFKLR